MCLRVCFLCVSRVRRWVWKGGWKARSEHLSPLTPGQSDSQEMISKLGEGHILTLQMKPPVPTATWPLLLAGTPWQ